MGNPFHSIILNVDITIPNWSKESNDFPEFESWSRITEHLCGHIHFQIPIYWPIFVNDFSIWCVAVGFSSWELLTANRGSRSGSARKHLWDKNPTENEKSKKIIIGKLLAGIFKSFLLNASVPFGSLLMHYQTEGHNFLHRTTTCSKTWVHHQPIVAKGKSGEGRNFH